MKEGSRVDQWMGEADITHGAHALFPRIPLFSPSLFALHCLLPHARISVTARSPSTSLQDRHTALSIGTQLDGESLISSRIRGRKFGFALPFKR